MISNAMSFEAVELSTLRPMKPKLRRHSNLQLNKLSTSLREFGCLNPLIVTPDGLIIDGEARYEALLAIGTKTIKVVVVSGLRDADLTTLRLALNRISQDSSWDTAVLQNTLSSLANAGIDLNLTGFEPGEIFLSEKVALDGLENSSRGSVPGDIWNCGRHVIGCGGPADPLFHHMCKGRTIKLAMLDYGNADADQDLSRICDVDDPCGRHQYGFNAFSAQFSVVKNCLTGPALIYAVANAQDFLELGAAAHSNNLHHLSSCALISKACLGRQFHSRFFELVSVFSLTREALTASGTKRRRQPRSDVWTYLHTSLNGYRARPVAFFRDLLAEASKTGDLVLDLDLRSGASLLAAEMTDRVCIGVERDPALLDQAITNWERKTGLRASLSENRAALLDVKTIDTAGGEM